MTQCYLAEKLEILVKIWILVSGPKIRDGTSERARPTPASLNSSALARIALFLDRVDNSHDSFFTRCLENWQFHLVLICKNSAKVLPKVDLNLEVRLTKLDFKLCFIVVENPRLRFSRIFQVF